MTVCSWTRIFLCVQVFLKSVAMGVDFSHLAWSKQPIHDRNADSYLSVPEIIRKNGYPVEEHQVVTEDGYILNMHRIPADGATPVFVMHGLVSSSADWVIAGPGKGLGYMLFDLGYDVWLGNARGNTFSKGHQFLSPRGSRYWQFSWHEIGTIDVPCMIDHVLRTTGASKLTYIGHSQGTTVLLVMLAALPEYNERVDKALLMAPVAYLSNAKNEIIKYAARFEKKSFILRKLIGAREFLPSTKLLKVGSDLVCNANQTSLPLCTNPIFAADVFSLQLLNYSLLPNILGHYPAGSSSKQFVHFIQIHNSGFFRQFDYGWFQNLFYYGRFSPPEYDLSKVKIPLSLFYGLGDSISTEEDVMQLHKILPTSTQVFRVPYLKFAHLDFLWAINVSSLCYQPMLQMLQKDILI